MKARLERKLARSAEESEEHELLKTLATKGPRPSTAGKGTSQVDDDGEFQLPSPPRTTPFKRARHEDSIEEQSSAMLGATPTMESPPVTTRIMLSNVKELPSAGGAGGEGASGADVDTIDAARARLHFETPAKPLSAGGHVAALGATTPFVPSSHPSAPSSIAAGEEASSFISGGDDNNDTKESIMDTMSPQGSIPSEFALDLFPPAFRAPPGSEELTALFNALGDDPAPVATLSTRSGLTEDKVRIMLQVLSSRGFVSHTQGGYSKRT